MKANVSSLILENLSAGYRGRTPILDELNHRFSSHGLNVVIGRNGAGKSTLVRTLAGLQTPLSGEVQLDGTTLHTLDSSERAKRIAFVSSVPPRTSELRVHEVLALASEDEEKRRSMLTATGDPSWWNRRLQELSDGEAQRVMFIRALLQGTDWILLDEPTAFLDIEDRLKIAKMIKNFIQMKEKSAFIIDHDMVFMDYLSDRLLVFQGKPGIEGESKEPLSMRDGMNLFLKDLGITFRRDDGNKRPRVNKEGSVKDSEQKKSGEYYYS